MTARSISKPTRTSRPAEVLKFFRQHLRVGYVSGLIVFDAIGLIPIARDLVIYESSERRLEVLMGGALEELLRHPWQVFGVFVFLSMVLPIIVAIGRFFTGVREGTRSILGRRGILISALHIVFTILLSLSVCLALSMVLLFGKGMYEGRMIDVFDSWTLATYSSTAIQFVGLSTLISVTLFGVLVRMRAEDLVSYDPKKVKRFAQTYYVRMSLAVLDRGYYPAHGRHQLNFVSSSLAPELKIIKRRKLQIEHHYQCCVPGSTASRLAAEKMFQEIRQNILNQFVDEKDRRDLTLAIAPGTSRAIEIAIKEGKPDKIIMSPYEHPSELAVAEWIAETSTINVKPIAFSPQEFEMDWGGQLQKVISRIERQILKDDKRIVFVVSHVCYATGLVIPVLELTERLRSKHPFLRIVIDGSHAIGNSNLRLINIPNSHYVFSAHKWLLAPEPCGIVVTSTKMDTDLTSYDKWTKSMPQATAGIPAAAGLYAALQTIGSAQREEFIGRTEWMRRILLAEVDGHFDVVGADSGLQTTHMLALKKVSRHKWNSTSVQEIIRVCERDGVYLTVLNMASQGASPEIWLRIAIPFFADYHSILRLAKTLRSTLNQNKKGT